MLYLAVVRSSFRRFLVYRAAALGGIFVNSIFGIVFASVYTALYRSRDSSEPVQGFDLSGALSFVWIAQGLLATVALWGWWEIAATIRTGDVVSDLMKPFNYFGYWLARDLGRAISQGLLRGLPTFIVGAVLYDIALPRSPLVAAAFLVSVLLAVVVSFTVRFLLNLATFWLTDPTGVAAISVAFINLLSGMILPLAFYPTWLATVANLLPFRAIIMSPVDVYLSRGSIAATLAIQAAWAIVLSLAGMALLGVAVRRVEIQGG